MYTHTHTHVHTLALWRRESAFEKSRAKRGVFKRTIMYRMRQDSMLMLPKVVKEEGASSSGCAKKTRFYVYVTAYTHTRTSARAHTPTP